MIGYLRKRSLKDAAAVPAQEHVPAEEFEASDQPRIDDPAAPHGDDTPPEELPDRYEILENSGNWAILDRQTGGVAETYGYRLARMSRARAESLVEVLNRGARRRPEG